MKTLNLLTGPVIFGAMAALGAMAATFAACSAQSSGTPPRPDGTSAGGSGNSAGASVIVGAGTTSTVNPGAAGTFGTGAGGTFGTGAGGTFGTGAGGTFGTGAGGAVASTGGSSAMGCNSLTISPADPKCCVAAGMATAVAIDDVEDSNNVILPVGNRQGYWYSYKDPGAATTQMPTGAPFPATPGGNPCSLTPVPPACALAMGAAGMALSTVASMGISGMVGIATDTVPAYAGLGFDFNNHFAKSCPYDATAYKGFTFYAKGSPFSVRVKIPATTGASAQSVGTCTAMCDGHYGMLIAPPPTGSWAKQTVTFSDPTFKPPSWVASPPAFQPNSILAVQFQVDGTTAVTPYGFAVDDLAFF